MTNEVKNVPELRFPEFSSDWEEKNLKDISNKGMYGIGASATEFDGKNVYVRITDINESSRKIDNDKLTSPDRLDKKYLLNENDVLFARTGASTGKTYIHKHYDRDKNYYFAGFLIKFAFNNNYLASFIFQNTLTKRFENWVSVMSVRSGQPGINSEEYGKLKMRFPNKVEQNKIGNFFTKLDRQIELEEQKLAKLEEQKKGYMQKIFSQELRFKDKNGNEYPKWEVIKLKDILSERKEYASKIGNYPHATLSTSGISLKSDRYNRDFLVKDKNKKYKVTIMNDICYNPANLKFGVITRNHIGSVIFSPIYITFEVNNAHSPLFIELLVTRNDFINRVRKYEEGTVYERMAVKPEDFLNYETKIPCLEEQEKIGDFFSKLDKVINKQRQKIDELKLRKQGLLQKMFV
ncbi:MULTISPECIES: restriction endonuclease subunit S [unclassified Mammaliicoccus]|uniref:restriction endonuclease subunit S n=1 Tax=unclassified Mammaliicoccus TaxID=2803851 RepID=UPI001EFAA783|nr:MULTISPECIES: restriction endonuclease subunit S [unclassified Mammaliicoccus]HDK8262626.1 restriction endonuclease subunit S [Staphylococcus aureus]HDK8262701.1 restriction endonuclease subunit S [Staphylococcus aureus]